MITRALVVGANAYEHHPLTAAVNDALAFRRALLDLGLVADEEHVTLLTSPRTAASVGEARFDDINEALQRVYHEGDDIDRFIFFFAGHGLLAFHDPSLTQAGTALMPVDVTNLERDTRNLIHLDELLSRLRLVGPQEQLYFIDACRNLPYKKHPGVSSLSWVGRTPGRPRRQAALYAVSELGQATERFAERGHMTGHLVDALHGKGCAMDYAMERDRYEVTMESIRNYVKARLLEELADVAGDPELALPSLESKDPKPLPLREIANPPPRSLTVHVVPDEAAAATIVRVGLGRQNVTHEWPPTPNHGSVSLDPRPVRLTAYSGAGVVERDTCYVDVREQEAATVNVRMAGGGPVQPSGPRIVVDVQEGPLTGQRTRSGRRAPAAGGTLAVRAHDGAVAIDVTDLQPPYARRTHLGETDLRLPAGGYVVEARLGPEPLWSTRVHVAAGERITVGSPEGGGSPYPDLQQLGLELAPPGEARRPTVVVVSDRPLVAGIGDRSMEMRPVSRSSGPPVYGAALGSSPGPFELNLDTEVFGRLAVASACLVDRTTVVTVRRDAGGRLDLRQNLFPQRGFPRIGPSVMRELEIAQQLYKSGELLDVLSIGEIDELVYGKWTDPLFGCMGAFASAGRAVDAKQARFLHRAGRNLHQYFRQLPDARIAATLLAATEPEQTLRELLDVDAVPVLAHSAQLLAAHAIETGQADHPAVARRAQIPAGQIWNLRHRD